MKKNCLKGFTDYPDFLSYADVLFYQSSEWKQRLYNYLYQNQETIDPVTEMRKLSAILYVQHLGAESYKKLRGEESFLKVMRAMSEMTGDLKSLLRESV
jgi:hypothetical protein